MTEALAPAFATDSATVLKTGTPSCVVPPLPGVTPPTTFVPYSIICLVWNVPSLPVMPCTTRRVCLSTRTLNAFAPQFAIYLARNDRAVYHAARANAEPHGGASGGSEVKRADAPDFSAGGVRPVSRTRRARL